MNSELQASDDGVGDDVADEVDDAVDENPWIEHLTRLGWVAKGVVYLFMGAIAMSIARQQPSDDDASPTGALSRVLEQPGGRLLLGVLAVGLALYAVWRFLSVAVIRGNGLKEWLDRIGYTFSALFYAVLGWVAIRGALNGSSGSDDNTVERLSRSVLEMTAGRWLLGIGGVATIGVGLYFAIRKGVMRSFVDQLTGVDGRGRVSTDDHVDRVLVVSGVAGWIGRGIVTVLVGYFVVRAAYRFDSDEARGFDRSLREVATTDLGTILVWVAAIGLMVYGAFCLLSHRRRTLEDNS